MERELKTITDERNFYQDMANDYSQLQDEYQDQRIQLERLMSTSADGNADVAQQSMRMEGRAVEEKGADARGNTELKKYREMTRQLLQAAEQHSEQLKKENEELRKRVAQLEDANRQAETVLDTLRDFNRNRFLNQNEISSAIGAIKKYLPNTNPRTA